MPASAFGGFEDVEAFNESAFPVLQGVEMPAFGESPRGCASEFGQLRRRCAVAHDIASDSIELVGYLHRTVSSRLAGRDGGNPQGVGRITEATVVGNQRGQWCCRCGDLSSGQVYRAQRAQCGVRIGRSGRPNDRVNVDRSTLASTDGTADNSSGTTARMALCSSTSAKADVIQRISVRSSTQSPSLSDSASIRISFTRAEVSR